MPQSGEAHCWKGIAWMMRAGKPAGMAVLGALLVGALIWGTFGSGVAAGRPSIQIVDDGQVAGVPFTIRGAGFGAGENIDLTVTHIGGAAEAGMGHETWTVIAQDGSFATTWSIHPDDSQGDRFLVRAVGGLSGAANAATFGRMAWVSTSLFDYAPGEYAQILGGGFRAGEPVTLQVIHTRGGTDEGTGHEPWTVAADASGRITSSWFVAPDDSLGAEFLLHAHGARSGLAATWAFMDAVCANPPPPDTVTPLTMAGTACPANLNSCTANDVTTTVVAATPVNGDVCSSETDTVTLDFTVRFGTTANQRYDLGVFIASDGLSLPGHTALACAGAAPQAGAGDGNADPSDCDSDRFLDLDPAGHKVGNPDTCGDLQNNAGPVFITFRATVACNHFDADHNLLVSSCRVWEQNGNHESACSTLAQAGAGSKCDCTDLSFAGLLDPCVTGLCDDGNACTTDSCTSSDGEAVCHNDPLANGSACDDGSACTESDSCQGGTCTGGGSPSCDDGNVCTDDVCDPTAGCTHSNNSVPCANGDFCDGAEVCTNGTCSSPGDPCTATGLTCDENGNTCVDCLKDGDCTEPGLPACNPATHSCSECVSDGNCPGGEPYCQTGSNTCVQCLNDAQCDDGNVCNGGETCVNNTCRSGTALGCDDHNPCTADSCNPGSGCLHDDVGDAQDGSCESVTDSSLCPFTDDTFRLINIQNPTPGATGSIVQNDFLLNATNPGQTYYNVFYGGNPGSSLSLQITIPWPYVTTGANPIQVHGGTGPVSVTLGDGRCFAPTPALSGYTVTTSGGKLSASGQPVILLGDYATQNLGGTTTVNVSGSVPSTGLAYVTIHLDYGLKKTIGWQQALDLTTLQGPDKNLDGTLDGFGSGAVFIKGGTPGKVNGQDYTFSFSYGPTLSSIVYSVNTFKKNPGVNGMALSAYGTPKPGVGVQFWSPTGNLLASTVTDQDGFFSFPYKHTGKPSTYSVKLPTYKQQQPVALKANGYALVLFESLPDADALSTTTSTWQKGMPVSPSP